MFQKQGRPSSISKESVASLSVYVFLVDFFLQPFKLCTTLTMQIELVRMPWPKLRLVHDPGQTRKISYNIHKCCMKNLTIFKLELTKLNMSQHVTTCLDVLDCWQSVVLSKFSRGYYEEWHFSVKGNKTGHGSGKREKENTVSRPPHVRDD